MAVPTVLPGALPQLAARQSVAGMLYTCRPYSTHIQLGWISLRQLLIDSAGHPFCMTGVGDCLALFRCISCRYGFSTDASCPELLGAPGRVFTSGVVRIPESTADRGPPACILRDHAYAGFVASMAPA